MPNPPATSHATIHYGLLVITTVMILVASLMILHYPRLPLSSSPEESSRFLSLLCENAADPAFHDINSVYVIIRSIHYYYLPTAVRNIFILKYLANVHLIFSILLGRTLTGRRRAIAQSPPRDSKDADTRRNASSRAWPRSFVGFNKRVGRPAGFVLTAEAAKKARA